MSYLTEIAIGLTAGEEAYLRAEPSGSVLEWFWPAFFMGAIFFLGVGLLGVHARLDGRSRVLGAIGAIPACVAVVAALINLVLLTGVAGRPTAVDGLGFAGVMGIMFGSTFLGIAAVRAKVFPRWVRFALALIVFTFIPAIVATIPLGGVLPDYVIANLPFVFVGAVLATVGSTMRYGSQGVTGHPAPVAG
jgi:hypothetical protein